MQRIEISTDILGNSIDEIISNIEGIINTIDHTYDGVCILNGMWEGPANQEFNLQFLSDYERLKEICSELNAYAGKLRVAKRMYEDAENRIGNVVSAINV